MYCCTLLYVHSSIAIILMGKRELIALLNLSSWCLVIVERLFLAVPWGCLQFVIVVFPDHTHLPFLTVYKWLYVNQMQKNYHMFIYLQFLFQKGIFLTARGQDINRQPNILYISTNCGHSWQALHEFVDVSIKLPR